MKLISNNFLVLEINLEFVFVLAKGIRMDPYRGSSRCIKSTAYYFSRKLTRILRLCIFVFHEFYQPYFLFIFLELFDETADTNFLITGMC